jgi:hypothetical protein
MAKNHIKDRSSLKSSYTLELGTMNDKSLLARFIYLKNQLCEKRWEYVINKETKIII